VNGEIAVVEAERHVVARIGRHQGHSGAKSAKVAARRPLSIARYDLAHPLGERVVVGPRSQRDPRIHGDSGANPSDEGKLLGLTHDPALLYTSGMELRFVSADLRELDALESEVLVCSLWQDARPCDGVAGLCDWRLAGRVSDLQRSGYLRGELGEVLLLPGRPRLSFDKVLMFGAGPRVDFDEGVFARVIQHMLATIEGLCSRLAVVQLPGRQNDMITAERAADMLLEAAAREPHANQHDVWTLVESAEARKRITQHMIEERRRVRRML
jgi:hypothetical protein